MLRQLGLFCRCGQDPAIAGLCRPCHAALHHRHQPSGWWPDLLVALWEEQHDGLPRQLAFQFTAAAPAAKAA